MHYNKKSLFFRKITAKIVGKSSHKRKGDKCHTAQRALPSHHHQEKSGNGGQPLLTAVKSGKDFAPPSLSTFTTAFNNTDDKNCIPKSNKPEISGLLAAKLKCDEWGLGLSQTQTTATKRVSTSPSQTAISNSSSPRRRRQPIQRPRLSNKVHHPSYKPPTVQRSTSMKERREAMEKTSKYHNQCFSSSLYRIDEVDEKGLD